MILGGDRAGLLILLRHGQSTANAAGLFTGVLDAPLSDLGVREAESAIILLRDAGLIPDFVYTSELARARQTADIVTAGLPVGVVRADWRLNERNYGALTGRSKVEVLREFGPDQFLMWRRSVAAAPPPMTNQLYNQLASTSLFRSLPSAALVRTESLRDVIHRVDAFYRETVKPLLAKGRTVLLVAHGNSLRALCGALDNLDDEALQELNIPTAQPLIYQFGEDLRPTAFGGEYLDESHARAAAIALANEGGT